MTIWIDLENSPHVPFFVPIIHELEARGVRVILTARDFAQTKQLVEDAGLEATIIGAEAGDNSLKKTAMLLLRAVRLGILLLTEKIDLAVGHGSRGLLLASKILLVRSLILYDYEGANVRLFNKLANWVMTPEIIPESKLAVLGLPIQRSLRYPGLKEEVYVAEFTPDPSFASSLRLQLGKTIVTVRPPSHTAHYKSDKSFQLFEGIMARLATRSDVQVLITPRSERQSDEIRSRPWFNDKIALIDKPVNGLDLLYHSDLVIGGGGTMNREAAVLGVPVVSIFKGESGAVDEWLESEGKLVNIGSADEIDNFIRKRDRSEIFSIDTSVKEEIVRTILELAQSRASKA
jgi:uncharacterized protein